MINRNQLSQLNNRNKVKPKGQLRYILIGALAAGGTEFIGDNYMPQVVWDKLASCGYI